MITRGMDVEPEDRRESVTLQQRGNFEQRERVIEDKVSERRLFSDRLSRFVYLAFGVLESLIGLRVLFKLIDANPQNMFARSLFQLTEPLLKPFANLVNNPAIGGIRLEATSLIAMLVFGLLCSGIVQLVHLVFYQTRTRTVAIYKKERQ